MTNKVNSTFVGSAKRSTALSIYYPEIKEDAPILLFAHGFKGFKDWGHFPQIQQMFAREGFVVVAFNFSHNGGTVENPIDFPDLEAFSLNTYQKELDDIGFVLNWINSKKETLFARTDLDEISLLGHSRGGGIALLAAQKYAEIKKVVTWAAVADFMEHLPNEMELKEWERNGVYTITNGRTKQQMPMKFDFVQNLRENVKQLSIENAVKNCPKPMLIIHGVNDETVDVENAARIQSWSENAQVELVENCNHTFNGKHPWNSDEVPEATIKALKSSALFLKS